MDLLVAKDKSTPSSPLETGVPESFLSQLELALIAPCESVRLSGILQEVIKNCQASHPAAVALTHSELRHCNLERSRV